MERSSVFFSCSFLFYEANFCVAKDLFSLIMNLLLNLVNVESIRSNNKCLSGDFVKIIRFQFEEIDFLITKRVHLDNFS